MESRLEPYCCRCIARFTQQRIPYMLKCCHLLCSECLVNLDLGMGGSCPLCPGEIVEGKFAPAFDVWDLIEIMRKWSEDFPPSSWPTVNKTNLLCWGVIAKTCANKGGTCPFTHTQEMHKSAEGILQQVWQACPPTMTSSGWRCRCDIEHVLGTACPFCLQSFSI